MSDARLDIEFDLEASRAELRRGKRRSSRGDRRVGLAVDKQNRRVLARWRYRLRRKETREGNECADLPAAGGDRVESDDRALRNSDESDPFVRLCETFAPDDVADQFVERFPGGHDLHRIKRVSFRREPLVAAPVMHGSVRRSEPCIRKTGTPGGGQRHELGARRADAVEEDDQVFGQLSSLKVGRQAEGALPIMGSALVHPDSTAHAKSFRGTGHRWFGWYLLHEDCDCDLQDQSVFAVVSIQARCFSSS